MDENELLQQFIQTGSQEAFAALVRLNADLVYSAARRQVRDPHLAEDISQAVFLTLARKASSVRGPLAGWLVLTTVYASRNAQRLIARRQFHERQAAMAKTEAESTQSKTAWEEFAPRLDGALARLKPKDRDAVALRFLRGNSLKEVGAALGISEQAARKRVERATEKLGSLLSTGGKTTPAAGLAIVLAERATQAAPPHLLSTIALQGPVAHAGSFAAIISQKTIATALIAKLKFAAAVLIALGLAGASVRAIAQSLNHERPASPVSAQMPPITPPAPPSLPQAAMAQVPVNISGRPIAQVVKWEAVLDDAGASALKEIIKPAPSQSEYYEAGLAGGPALRAFCSEQKKADHVTNFPNSLVFSDDRYGPTSMDFTLVNYFDLNQETHLGYAVDSTGLVKRVGDDAININLNIRNMPWHPAVGDARNKWKWTGHGSFSIAYAGQLKIGDAVTFQADFSGTGGKTYHHLIVFEAFAASAQEMPYFRQKSCAAWCDQGPQALRSWADEALNWQLHVPDKPSPVAPEFEKQLEDGSTIRLIGINRPNENPFCWWDPQGDPVSVPLEMTNLYGEPTDLIYLTFGVIRPAQTQPSTMPTPLPDGLRATGPTTQLYSLLMKNELPTVDVGVLVGPSSEATQIKPGTTQTVDGFKYKIGKPIAFSANDFNIELNATGGRDHEDIFTAIGKHGQEVHPENLPHFDVMLDKRHVAKSRQDFGVFRGLPAYEIQYFQLSQQKREWVSFTNYAMEPKTSPSDLATPGTPPPPPPGN